MDVACFSLDANLKERTLKARSSSTQEGVAKLMTVSALREMCRSEGLQVSGKKLDLIERLASNSESFVKQYQLLSVESKSECLSNEKNVPVLSESDRATAFLASLTVPAFHCLHKNLVDFEFS